MPIGMVPGGGHAALLARHANEVPGAECWSSLVRKILPQIRTDPIEPGESSVFVTLPPPLAQCKLENRSLAGPFSLCAKGVCGDHPPFGDWPTARDRSPNAHRLFPPAPRSQRDGFKTPIDFNELTGARCARVSLVPACLKADGDATRAAWWLVCLGSFARSL